MAIRITVKEGTCQGKRHKIGDTFTVENTTPGGMCLGAWNAVASPVSSLRLGANFPWEKEKGIATIHCPDPKGITLELKRIDG